MNERMVKLFEQAGISDSINEEFGIEYLAELIVRECQFAIVSRTDLPKHERKLYNNVLKEHFGVEE